MPILYVEDEETDVLLMQLGFEQAGLGEDLKIVTNGQDALDYLSGVGPFADRERYPLPCLVLLDLNLPRRSGLEVLQWIRERPEFNALPVIIYTSSDYGQDYQRAKELGGNEFVTKQAHVDKIAQMARSLKEQWAGVLGQSGPSH